MKRLMWIFLTSLSLTALVLTSCEKEAVIEEEGTTIITGITQETDKSEVVKPPDTTRTEKPQYGGGVTLSLTADIPGFDEVFVGHWLATTLHLTNEELLQGDWTKGPAGTNEANFILGGVNAMNLKTGAIADSWQIPQRGKIVFHIRAGVRWHTKAPTNGRELTVDDVVFSMKRVCTLPTAYIYKAYNNLSKNVVITGDEAARTVTIEVTPNLWIDALTVLPDLLSIMPRDAVEYYKDLNNWRNSIGTGPFILSDFVSSGSATLIRNPNYWGVNPIGPGKGDQLPYLETVKFLIIPDASSRMAAFRTAKIDGVGGEYDDVKEFLDNPKINNMMYLVDGCYTLGMRQDMPESPFSKKDVRQALYYATDFGKIKNEYYNGKATVLVWPITYSKENSAAYVPMEKLPANVQDLFSYNPTKAREMLKAAGYPSLNINIITYNTPTFVDFISLIKQMWSQVGINVTIDAKEYVTWLSRTSSRNYGANDMLYASSSGSWQSFDNINGPKQFNISYINDPVIAETATKVSEYIGIDDAKVGQMHAELMPYVIEQCWVIAKPAAYSYVLWWSWRKNWNGELNVGFYNNPSYLKYTWTDLALRKEISGR